MLKMGGETPVSGHRRPLVVQNLHFRCSHRDHGLNTQHHAGLERQRRFRGHNVVGNFGFFVQRRTDAVPNKPSYHMEPGTFGVFLHSASDVVEFITGISFSSLLCSSPENMGNSSFTSSFVSRIVL